MPDGSTQPLAGGDLRITEVTVGATGAGAMTAPLPPESGYTYAVELSVDEAEAAGATELVLLRAAAVLHGELPRLPGRAPPSRWGTTTSSGAAWVAGQLGPGDQDPLGDGRHGRSVDTDGDDIADNTGIGNAEREQLAALYDPGDELWRVELPHFSTWDLNWGVRPPEDARPPEGQPAPGGGGGRSGGGGRARRRLRVDRPRGPGARRGHRPDRDGLRVEPHHTRRSVGFDAARTVEVRVEDPLPGP